MEFTVVDPSGRKARIPRRGGVVLIVRDGEPEVLLVPSSPECVVLEVEEETSPSDPAAPLLRVIWLKGRDAGETAEGLTGVLRRLADVVDPERSSEKQGTEAPNPGLQLVMGRGRSSDLPSKGTSEALDRADRETLSHELRTPINALVGYAALLDDAVYGDLTAEQAEAVRHMRESTQRLLIALPQLFQLSQVDLGEIEELANPSQVERDDTSRSSSSG